LET
ncbi:hypothetical protein D046_2993B, partial [Vibrio parahaemolyticus V-223/04]|jgi:hypothetical protein